MAKELPYFKFEPAEYLTKDISFCSLSAQGLFINICSYYWQRNCKLTKEQLLKRLNHETELNELIREGVIDLNDSNIIIKFLDLQLVDVSKTSKVNSINGAKGGRPKKAKQNPKESQTKPNALISLSETKGIREDKIILDEIKEEEKIITINNKKFISKGLTDMQWLEILAIQNRVSLDMVKNKLTTFDDFLISTKKQHSNYKEFASHFNYWLAKNKPETVKQRIVF